MEDLTFLILIMGLCWGSFLNVLIVRSLNGESVLAPASKCPACNNKLLWWQNIPIISYIILKGKCYFCKEHISLQYPIIELCGGIIFLFALNHFPSLFDGIAAIIIISMFLTMSVTDIKEQKISKRQAIAVLLAGILFNRYNIMNSILGFLIGAVGIFILSRLGYKLFKRELFGYGDIYLIGALGSVVGLDRMILYLIYALFIELILIIPNYIVTLIERDKFETLRYLIFFTLACLFLYLIKNLSFWGSNALFIGMFALIVYLAYKLTQNLTGILKEQEYPSYCPIAPALAISCLIFLI